MRYGNALTPLLLELCRFIMSQRGNRENRVFSVSPNPFPSKPWFFIYKSLENTVGKGGIACNEQFLFLPQCFLPIWRTFWHLKES